MKRSASDQAISALTGVTPGTVLCVAGDPFGMVGDRRDVTAADYAQHRDWDGIAPLRETLLDPQGDLLRHGVDVMVLEGGAAQLGRIVGRRREADTTAHRRAARSSHHGARAGASGSARRGARDKHG